MTTLRRRRAAALLLALTAVLVGCSDDEPVADEPSAPAPPTGSGPTPSAPPSAVAYGVPVAGAFVLYGGDEGERPVRVAVHGVRRVEGATVLDWSVTALPSAAAEAGEPASVPAGTVDIDSLFGYHNIDLVDPVAGDVLRPLTAEPEGDARAYLDCACRPYYAARSTLRVAETALLQLSFAPLPEAVREVDVSIPGVPAFEAVPVAPEGQVAEAGEPVDLAAPPEALPVLATSEPFTYAGGQQVQVSVNQVLASASRTSVVWTIDVLSGAGGLAQRQLPFTDSALVPPLTNDGTDLADGPALSPTGTDPATAPVLRASYSSLRARTDVPPGVEGEHTWYDCRCTDLGALRRQLDAAGGSAQVVTDYGPLPAGTTTAQLTLPGAAVPALTGLPVEQAAASPRTTFVDADPGTWERAVGEQGPAPFTLADWPTPVLSPASLRDYPVAVVDELRVTTTQPNVKTEDTPEVVALTLDTEVFFGPDSADIRPETAAALQAVAAQIDAEARPGSTVLVVGHVAALAGGSDPVRQQLSDARAQAVLAQLEPLVSADVTLQAEGRGGREPVAPNDDEAGRQQNRRVVVTFER